MTSNKGTSKTGTSTIIQYQKMGGLRVREKTKVKSKLKSKKITLKKWLWTMKSWGNYLVITKFVSYKGDTYSVITG